MFITEKNHPVHNAYVRWPHPLLVPHSGLSYSSSHTSCSHLHPAQDPRAALKEKKKHQERKLHTNEHHVSFPLPLKLLSQLYYKWKKRAMSDFDLCIIIGCLSSSTGFIISTVFYSSKLVFFFILNRWLYYRLHIGIWVTLSSKYFTRNKLFVQESLFYRGIWGCFEFFMAPLCQICFQFDSWPWKQSSCGPRSYLGSWFSLVGLTLEFDCTHHIHCKQRWEKSI